MPQRKTRPSPPAPAADGPDAMRLQRGPDDDFFCLRYHVWYPSLDCAVRTKFRTCAGCLHCEQGRFNLRRHAATLARLRFPFPPAGLE